MAYTRTTWENGVTPLNATNMNNIEDGIEEALASGITHITPEQYGAIGNGISDDTEAFQDALDNASGKILYLKNKYKITSTLYVSPDTIIYGEKSAEIHSYISGILFDSHEDSGRIQGCHFIGGKYYNKNTTTDDDGIITGTFINHLRGSTFENCSVNQFAICFQHVNNTSKIHNNNFIGIYRYFALGITDSMISSNYINASARTVASSIMIYGTINNSNFSGNFVDYFGSCFRLQSGTKSSQIIGNTFDDCRCVFRDFIAQLTIIGNTFSNIKYVDANWSAVKPPVDIQTGIWAIWLFNEETELPQGNRTMILYDVTFNGNLSRNCDYYIYCEKPILSCQRLEFRGNSIFEDNTKNYRAVLNTANTSSSFNNGGLRSVYFDFLDGREVDSLTQDSVLGRMTTLVNSNGGLSIFENMHVIYNGVEYVNRVDDSGNCNWTSIGNYVKPETGIPTTDFNSDAQNAIALASTAVQPSALSLYSTTSEMNSAIAAHHDDSKQNITSLESDVAAKGFTKNAGTITGITMNGSSQGTSGIINLGTVITSHQSLAAYRTSAAQDIIDSGKQDIINAANKLSYSFLSGTPTIPTTTSQLSNDSGFITSSYHDSTKQNISSLESDVKAFINKSYIQSLLTDAEGVDF